MIIHGAAMILGSVGGAYCKRAYPAGVGRRQADTILKKTILAVTKKGIMVSTPRRWPARRIRWVQKSNVAGHGGKRHALHKRFGARTKRGAVCAGPAFSSNAMR